jgi:hypothetical protein
MNNKLEIIEEIRQKKAAYCRFLDTKKFNEWGKLFIPEAKVTMFDVEGNLLYGFDSFEELKGPTVELFSVTQTIHQVHNMEVEFISETEASVIWSMEDMHINSPESNQPFKTLHGYGHYYETWKLVGNEWLIARVELRRSILEFN